MSVPKSFKILIAETAPILLTGLINSLRNFKEFPLSVTEVDTRKSLFESVSSNKFDIILINPEFGGLLHPDEIRKSSINPHIKILAIEINKLNRSILSLYDNKINVTDELDDIKKKISDSLNLKDEEEIEEKENLSLREKEIISFVVKGFTNQEIADKLFLSVHTVMTHRRNIARKLQIHSATGLTIYAIVNKIVDLSDIKL